VAGEVQPEVVAGGEEGDVVGPSMYYSVRPLVLGPAYNIQDIEVRAVNKLDTKVGLEGGRCTTGR